MSVDVDSELVDAEESSGDADATPQPVIVTPSPTPRAMAKPPTRPTYAAALILRPQFAQTTFKSKWQESRPPDPLTYERETDELSPRTLLLRPERFKLLQLEQAESLTLHGTSKIGAALWPPTATGAQIPKGSAEMVAAAIRTVFAQPDAEHVR